MNERWLYRVVLLPAAVFLSVVFAGSYGTGQETIQFLTAAGPTGGYLASLTVALVWGLLLGTSIEISRLFKVGDYGSFMRVLMGRGAILYEVAIMVAMIIALAVCASGAGSVIGEHFGIPIWLGSLGLLAIAITLNYFGQGVIEKSMLASIIVLVAVLIVLLVSGMNAEPWGAAATATELKNPILAGGQYAIVNGGYIPLMLYCGRLVRTRAESFIAGFAAGGIAIVPGIFMHTTFLKGYPEILGETLPMYEAIGWLMPPVFLTIYVLVMFVMITQTAVGMVKGLADRTDAFSEARRGRRLSKVSHGLLAAGMILASMALASVGFVNLIAHGYDFLVVVFIVVFVIPLFTYGFYLLWNNRS